MARTLAMFTDTSLCIGCRACQVACKQWNELGPEVPEWTGGYQNHAHFTDKTFRLVRFIEEPRQPQRRAAWLLMSDVCKHCAQAGCLDACPTGAIYRTEYGTVNINQDICNGCRYCVVVLPLRGRQLQPRHRHRHEVHVLQRPHPQRPRARCAKACPTESIQFGFRDDLVAKAQQRVETLKGMGFKDAQLYGADSERLPRRSQRVLPAAGQAIDVQPPGQSEAARSATSRRLAALDRLGAGGRARASCSRSASAAAREAPMLKTPAWEMMIVWYFFLGGIAGGAYFTAAIADNFGSAARPPRGPDRLPARRSPWSGSAGSCSSPTSACPPGS